MTIPLPTHPAGEKPLEQAVWDVLRWRVLRQPGREGAVPTEAECAEAEGILQARIEAITRRTFRRRAPRGSLVEDVIADVWESVLRYVESHPERPEFLDGFLFYRVKAVLRRQLNDRLREQRSSDDELEHQLLELARPTLLLEATELKRALAECVGLLEPIYREAWAARFGRRATGAQASEPQGQARKTMRARCARALETVFDCLVRKKVLEETQTA